MAAEGLNEELAKSLQLAKKKPCNFAIVGKGANVPTSICRMIVAGPPFRPRSPRPAR